jgi:hypothetical protein
MKRSLTEECCRLLDIQLNRLIGEYGCEDQAKLMETMIDEFENTESEREYYGILTSIFRKLHEDWNEDIDVINFQVIDNITGEAFLIPVIYNLSDGEKDLELEALIQLSAVENEWETSSIEWLIEQPNTPISEVMRKASLGKLMCETMRHNTGEKMRAVRRLLSDYL